MRIKLHALIQLFDHYNTLALWSYVSQEHAAAHSTGSSLQLTPYPIDVFLLFPWTLYDSHCFHPSSFCSFCSIFGNTNNQICWRYCTCTSSIQPFQHMQVTFSWSSTSCPKRPSTSWDDQYINICICIDGIGVLYGQTNWLLQIF